MAHVGVATAFIAGLVLALAVIVIGNTNVDEGEQGGTGPLVVTAITCAVLTGILYWLVRSRWHSSPRATIVLGVLSVVTLIIFWSGVSLVLSAATWAAATGQTERPKPVTAALVVAALSAVLVLIFTLIDSF